MTGRLTALELADQLAAAHEDFFKEKPKGELLTAVLVEGGDGQQIIVACPWSDGDQRALVIAMLRELLHRLEAVRYAMWSEAWTIDSPEAIGPDYEQGDISRRPDRREVIMTVVVDAKENTPVCIQQRIIRGRHGGVRKLERREGNWDGITGALTTLLPERAYQ